MTELFFLKPRLSNPHLPLFVYLPGMDSTGQLLNCQLDRLAADFDVRCAAIPAENNHSWEDLVEELLGAIARECRDRPVYLCGESFGACLALKAAIAHPEAISALILSNPASSFHQSPFFPWIVPIVSAFPEPLYPAIVRGLLPFLVEIRRTTQKNRAALQAAMLSISPQTVGWRLSLLCDFALEDEQLRRFPKPVLLIAGGSDRLLPSGSEVRRLARLFPNAQTCILPDSGHACLLETEIQLARILRESRLSRENANLYNAAKDKHF